MKKISIRPPKESEFGYIHSLVRELAIFEKAPELHTVTPAEYLEDYRKGWFEVEMAVQDNEIIGMIFFYQAYSTWRGRMLYLEDFIVTDKCRSQGVGKQLFRRFLEIARDRNCALAKWQVLDWNKRAISFYEREGAIIEKEWWSGKVILDQ